MDAQKKALLKQFSLLLRNLSKNENVENEMTPTLVKFYSRKQLIEIIKNKFEGTIPKEYSLLEMENEELLSLIGDDMYLIAHTTKLWAKELSEKKGVKANLKTEPASLSVKSPPNANTSKSEKVSKSK